MSPYTVQSPWVSSITKQPAFTREQALSILEDHVQNQNLRKHMYATEAAMRTYATIYGGDPEEWGIVGLLHDFDWEIHPTLEEHPAKGQSILEGKHVPETIRKAIMAHAPHTGVNPSTPMEKCIFAVDEISGFIVACALVTPDKKLANVSVESIKKKLKQRSFAAKVNRDEIAEGVALLGISEDQHFANVLQAMQDIHEQLSL